MMEHYEIASTYSTEIEAELAQATLAAAGIESFLKYEDAGGMLAVFQQTGGVKVLVAEEKLAEAKTVLSEQAQQQQPDP